MSTTWTQRENAVNYDQITTYDASAPLGGATYSAGIELGCNCILFGAIIAVPGLGPFVQSASSASTIGSYTTITQAFANPTTAGNILVIDIVVLGTFPLVSASCSDSQSNIYSEIIFGHVPGSADYIGTFMCVCGAGANTVTITLTGPGTPAESTAIAVHEYEAGTASVPGDWTPGLSVSPGDRVSGSGTVQICTTGGVTGSGTPTWNTTIGGSTPDGATVVWQCLYDLSQSNSIINPGSGTINLQTQYSGTTLHFFYGVLPECPDVTVTGPGGPADWLVVNEPATGSPATGGGLTRRGSFLFADASGSNHSFTLRLRERGTANYRLVSDPNNPTSVPTDYEPTMGQPIYLFDQNAGGYILMFAGLIQDFTIVWVGIGGLRYIDCSAVSLESVFDTVYAQPMQFVNQTCGDILTALFNAFENGCPVALGLVQAGPSIDLFNASLGDKLSDLFDQLATTALFTWGVDPQTQLLFFCLPTAVPAPFTIESSNVLWDTISQKYDNADYRNRQAVKLSYDAFPHSQENFVGTGQSSFTLMRPVEQVTNAWITTSTPNTATALFTGQPSPGDTITVGPSDGMWQASHIYGLGGIIVVGGYVWKVTVAGTSGSSEPAFGTLTVLGDTIQDNTAIWTNQGPAGLGTGFNTYTFVTALDNTQFGEILIDPNGVLANTVQNTADALNAVAPYSGTPATKGKGLTVSLPTWENSQVNAIDVNGTGFTVSQKAPGSGWVAGLSSTGTAFAWSAANTSGGTSPQTSVGPNEGATINIAVFVSGTATSAPCLVYTPGSALVSLATPLNSGTNLSVEYTRTDGDVIEVENTPAVQALAVVSHGTGKYQQSTDQSSQGLLSTAPDAGLQFAQEILATFDVTQQKFSLDFYRPGILPGQVLVLDLNAPLDVMNGSYLVLSVKGQMVYKWPYMDSPEVPFGGHYKYTVELINVNLIGTDLAFWLGLGGGGGGGGSGTAGALTATSGGASSSTPGTPLTVGGVLEKTSSYSTVAADNGKLIVFNNASAVTLTLPATTPPFPQWCVFVENIGAGVLTIDPNGLDLDGSASSLTVGTGSGIYLTTDGTNYFSERGLGPLTTKGDLYTFSTEAIRLPVGSNGQLLMAESAAATGLAWETPRGNTTVVQLADSTSSPTSGDLASFDADANIKDSGILASSVMVNPMTTKGDVIIAATGGTPARLGVGSNKQVLTANSSATDGVDWESLPVATSSQLGLVEPDGTIITVSAGLITVPKASPSVFGVVEVDNVTITEIGGVISTTSGAGFVNPMTVPGDLIVGGTSGSPQRLGIPIVTNAIRGTGILTTTASSFTIPIPTGSLAGDDCIVFCASQFNVSSYPSGWTQISVLTSPGGTAIRKVLSSGDISAGTVGPIVFFTSAPGTMAIITFVGAAGVQRSISNGQPSSGSPFGLSLAPVAGDSAIYFGAIFPGSAVSGFATSRGTAQQTAASSTAGGILSTEQIAATGSVTQTYSWTAASSFDGYFVNIVLQPNTATIVNGLVLTTNSSAPDGLAWETPASGGGTVTAVTGSGAISSSGGTTPNITVATATTSSLGVVEPDGSTIDISAGVISVPTATSSALGLVKPDGTIITVSAGAITVPKGSASAFGVVEVDNVTITASSGVISAVGVSPLTMKGDLYTYGSTNARLPVGANGLVLTANSSATNGIDWEAASGGANGSGIVTGSVAAVALTTTTYIPFGGGGVSSTTEANVDMAAPNAATVGNFFVQISAAPGTGNSLTLTVRQNGSSTAVTVTISGSATSASDLTHTFNAAQGDLLDIQLVPAGTIVVSPNIITSIQWGASAAVIPLTTKGDILTDSGSGLVRLGVGSNGQVLTANSAATNGVNWAAPGGGGLTQIAQQVLASPAASVAFSSIPGTYTNLLLIISARSAAAVTNEAILIEINTDTTASDYINISAFLTGSYSGFPHNDRELTFIPGASAATGAFSAIDAIFPSYASTANLKSISVKNSYLQGSFSDSNFVLTFNPVMWNNTAAIVTLTFTTNSGSNFVTGSVFTLYGLQ